MRVGDPAMASDTKYSFAIEDKTALANSPSAPSRDDRPLIHADQKCAFESYRYVLLQSDARGYAPDERPLQSGDPGGDPTFV